MRCGRGGGPEVLAPGTVAVPRPGPGEVLLRVHAASVNFLDVWLRRGALTLPLPHTPGCDGAGVAVAVGPGVSGVTPGGAYLIHPGLSCGVCSACAGGQGQLCPQFAILGAAPRVAGTYAEFVLLPGRNLLPLPEGLDMAAAATLGVAGVTAWHLLVTRARLRPGDTVLVPGAGGGVGTFAVQIARLWGARVLATAGGAEKCQKVLKLGAEACFDHSRGAVAPWVREQTGGWGADVVLNHTGAERFADDLAALAVGGRLLVCGTTTGATAQLPLRDLFSRQQSVLGARLGGISDLHALLARVAAGAICPVIDRTFPLRQAGEAHAWLESRGHFGKVVLDVRNG